MAHGPTRVEFLGSFTRDLLEPGLPEVAFAGRSNVGKSSALNRLLDRKGAARVSSTPGRTQAVNLFECDGRMVVADLPGYGYAKVPDAVQATWAAAMATYLAEREALKLVVVLVDARRDPQTLDAEMIDVLATHERPTLVVATKVDKLKRSQRVRQLAAIRKGHGLSVDSLLPFSSVTGEGRDELWAIVRDVCGG